METFNFYKDEKCTIWNRGHFQIEAETYEDAVQKIKSMEETPTMYNEVDVHWEDLPETITELYPKDNDGCSTIEIYSYDKKGELIFQNGFQP